MPKLQSANGRLNVLSKSGCFFYYLFLLFELCHITISLQEWINNSSRPPRCSVVSHLHPQPLRQDFGARDVFKAAKKGSAGLLLLLWVWKTWSQWGFVTSNTQERWEFGNAWGTANSHYDSQMLQVLECPITQRCTTSDCMKVTPIFWRWHSPNPWAHCWGCRTAPGQWEGRARGTRTWWLAERAGECHHHAHTSQSHQEQLSFAASKAGRGQVNIGEEKQQGHIFLCKGPKAVRGVDGRKCFCFRLENAKERLHKLFSVLEEEWIDLKDRWCLWNMQIKLSWSKQLPFHCPELQTERNDSQETKHVLKGRRWEGRLHQEENGGSMEKNIPDLLLTAVLGKRKKQPTTHSKTMPHRRAEFQNILKSNCYYWF